MGGEGDWDFGLDDEEDRKSSLSQNEPAEDLPVVVATGARAALAGREVGGVGLSPMFGRALAEEGVGAAGVALIGAAAAAAGAAPEPPKLSQSHWAF